MEKKTLKRKPKLHKKVKAEKGAVHRHIDPSIKKPGGVFNRMIEQPKETYVYYGLFIP